MSRSFNNDPRTEVAVFVEGKYFLMKFMKGFICHGKYNTFHKNATTTLGQEVSINGYLCRNSIKHQLAHLGL